MRDVDYCRLLETVIDFCTRCGPTMLDILEHSYNMVIRKKHNHTVQYFKGLKLERWCLFKIKKKIVPIQEGGVQSDLIVSVLQIEWSGFEPWSGTLCCVLGQDTLLSKCLSPSRCINGYQQTLMLGITLQWTSIPSRGEYKYATACHRNQYW